MPIISVTVDVPDFFDESVFERTLSRKLDYLLNDTIVDVNATSAYWADEDKPALAKEAPHQSGDTITAALRVVGKVWNIVDQGSPPYGPIVAKRSKDGMLHYQADFTPKTTPRTIGSRSGGKRGRWIVRKTVPWHPGFEPREFVITILKEHAPDLVDLGLDAFTEATK